MDLAILTDERNTKVDGRCGYDAVRHVWHSHSVHVSHGFDDYVVQWNFHQPCAWPSQFYENTLQCLRVNTTLLTQVQNFHKANGRQSNLVPCCVRCIHAAPCDRGQPWVAVQIPD